MKDFFLRFWPKMWIPSVHGCTLYMAKYGKSVWWHILWYKKFYVTNNNKTQEHIQGISGTTHI